MWVLLQHKSLSYYHGDQKLVIRPRQLGGQGGNTNSETKERGKTLSTRQS